MKPVDLSSRRVAPAHLMVLKFKVQHLQACQESMYICRFQLKPVDLHVIFLDNEIYRNKYENSLFYIADDLGSIIYRFHRIVKTLKVHKSSAPQTPVVVFFTFPCGFGFMLKKQTPQKQQVHHTRNYQVKKCTVLTLTFVRLLLSHYPRRVILVHGATQETPTLHA